MSGQRVILPGSEPHHEEHARWSPAPPEKRLTVSIYLRRNPDFPLSSHLPQVSREQAVEQLGASPRDLQNITNFAKEHGLCIVEENAPARRVRLEGTIQQWSCIFKVQIGLVEHKNESCISYQGPLTLPASLQGVITAVLGLDQRPIAKHAFR